jgi:hypothetical protein
MSKEDINTPLSWIAIKHQQRRHQKYNYTNDACRNISIDCREAIGDLWLAIKEFVCSKGQYVFWIFSILLFFV